MKRLLKLTHLWISYAQCHHCLGILVKLGNIWTSLEVLGGIRTHDLLVARPPAASWQPSNPRSNVLPSHFFPDVLGPKVDRSFSATHVHRNRNRNVKIEFGRDRIASSQRLEAGGQNDPKCFPTTGPRASSDSSLSSEIFFFFDELRKISWRRSSKNLWFFCSKKKRRRRRRSFWKTRESSCFFNFCFCLKLKNKRERI